MICSNMQLHHGEFQHDNKDPLWRANAILHDFNCKGGAVAVPVESIALDKSAMSFSGKSAAMHYMPAKPHPYNIRIYTVTESSLSTYIASIFYNGKGNTSSLSLAEQFVQVYPDM